MTEQLLGTLAVNLEANIAEFVRNMRQVGTIVSRHREGFTALALGAGVLTGALTLLGRSAVRAGIEFDSAMTRVKAISNATAEQFSQLEGAALSMSEATIFSAKEVAEGMNFMAMAGNDVNKILGGMPNVLNLATVGALDLGSAADIVTNIMAGFGQNSEELSKSVDVLANAITNSNVDVRQLGESFKYAGPVAKAAGVSFEETTAILSKLGNAGIQGSLAGTTLKNAITQLLTPTGAAKKVLKDLGVSTRTSTGDMRNMVTILTELEATGINAAQTMQLFGKRAGPGMAALLENGIDNLTEFEEILGTVGTAARINETIMGSFSGQVKQLESKFGVLLIKIQKGLVPALTKLNNILAAAIDWFNNLDPSTQQMIVNIGLVVTAISGVVAGLSTLGLLLPSITAAFSLLGAIALKAILPIIAIVAGVALQIGFVLVAIGALKKVWRQDFSALQDVSETFVGNLKKIFGQLFKFLSMGFKSSLKDISETAIAAAGMITGLSPEETFGMIQASRESTAGLFSDPAEAIKDSADYVLDKFEDAGKFLKQQGKSFGNELEEAFFSGAETFGISSDKLKNTFKDIAKIIDSLGGKGFGGGPATTIDTEGSDSSTKTGGGPATAGVGTGVGGGEYARTNIRQKLIEPDEIKSEEATMTMKEAGESFALSLASSLGETGELINSAMQGFTQGGPWGAVAAVVLKVIQQSAALSAIFGKLTKILDIATKSLEPVFEQVAALLEAFLPLLSIAMALNEATIGALEPVLTRLGQAISFFKAFMDGFINFWNRVVNKLADAIGKVTKKGARIIRKLLINTEEESEVASEALQEKALADEEYYKNLTSSFGSLDDAVKNVTDSLLNVPEAFKVGLRRFESITGETISPESRQGGTNVFIDTVDPTSVRRALKDAAENDNYILAGSKNEGYKPFSTDQKGS